MANENNNTDSRCRTCKHKRNCINGMYCTLIQSYVEYADTTTCEHYSIDMDDDQPAVRPKWLK